MKKLSNKLFLSVISLLLVVATLGSATFAWMSLNSDSWVENMQFQATGGEGFLIAIEDNDNLYKSHLNKDDIVKSIVRSYSNYAYQIDLDGNLVDSQNQIVQNYSDIMDEQIKLYPCTSYGFDENLVLTKLNGEVVQPSDGQYIEFKIYFKPTYMIKNPMDIYINGRDRILMQNNGEYPIPATKISTAKLDEVTLSQALISYVRDPNSASFTEALEIKKGEVLTVRSSNAIRLGYKNDEDTYPTIIELSDEYDLGSYATNIVDYTDVNSPSYDDSILYDVKYDATKNAMFTYFNGLKNNSLKAIDYKKIPRTISSLTDYEGNNRVRVCTLGTDGNRAEVTFKLWLEGWDADSIEGIAESISVQLSFAQ